MSFANHNILDIALSLIPPTTVQIRKNLGTKVNAYGQVEAEYGEWIDVYGIVQPGGEQNEHTEGIDFAKKHVTVWLRGIALDGTHIQWAPDQIRYVGKIFNVIGVKDWFPYDNFKECECVEVLNLDESQRGKAALMSTRGRVLDKAKSLKSYAMPQGIRTRRTDSQTNRKPSIFCPDEPKNDNAETNVGDGAKEIAPTLVGKASIRF